VNYLDENGKKWGLCLNRREPILVIVEDHLVDGFSNRVRLEIAPAAVRAERGLEAIIGHA
jgi:hypothetical protein